MQLENKNEIRKFIKEKREALSVEYKRIYDDIIFNKLILLNEYKESKIIFIYVSFDKEVDTHRIIKYSLDNNKIICVPKIISKAEGMLASRIKSFEDLSVGKYGILEPMVSNEIIKPEDIDLILTPGVAFDSLGFRLGYGGGFYDRFLDEAGDNASKIALAYDFQILKKIPVDDFDRPVDFVITN